MTAPITKIAAIDTETSGLSPATHDIWEFAAVLADHDPDTSTLTVTDTVHLDIPISLRTADSTALRIGGYYARRIGAGVALDNGAGGVVMRRTPEFSAQLIASAIADRHVVGVNPAFDVVFIDRLLRRHDQAPAHHYHLIDLLPLAAGVKQTAPPWKSTDLAETFGVTVAEAERHTALGDARWALRWYAAIYGLQVIDRQEGMADVA